MGLNQAKLRPGSHQIKNIVKMSPIGSHTTKNVANWVLHNQKPVSRPDKQVEEKEKPQVRGCRTLVQRGTGRQDSPGRGDGLGWTTSTPPDSNGVPRDVPDSPELCTHSTKMSVFWAHQRKSSASIESQTGGKSAHRSKPVKSRPDRPGKKSKPHGTEVGQNWVRYPQTDPDAPGCKGTLG